MVIIASTNMPDGIWVAESQAKTESKEPKEKQEQPAATSPAASAEHAPAAAQQHGGGEPAEEEAKPVSIDEVKTYTDAEIEVLERLSERRERLLKWEKDLQVKENVLKITEEKIDNKMEALRQLKKEVEASLAEYRKEEDEKTKSLVKIYEQMKPKNAADIFSKMRVEDIVPLIDKMKEKNAAEVLAKMEPRIAKEVTTRLNNVGKIRGSQTTGR